MSNPARFVATASVPATKSATKRTKSATTAVLLSLLLIGAGHWYTGEVGRGFVFLGAAVVAAFAVAYVIGLVAVLVVAIWAAIDAGKSAERHNARLAAGL